VADAAPATTRVDRSRDFMQTVSVFIIAVLILGTAGCQAAYDSLRMKQEMDCQQMLGADRAKCLQTSGMSYDEYRRQLKKQEQNTEQ
jgi:hypothetical protein